MNKALHKRIKAVFENRIKESLKKIEKDNDLFGSEATRLLQYAKDLDEIEKLQPPKP